MFIEINILFVKKQYTERSKNYKREKSLFISPIKLLEKFCINYGH